MDSTIDIFAKQQADFKIEFDVNLLINKLKLFIDKYCTKSAIWVAFSGGLDSSVLLHALKIATKYQENSISAVYINHSVHPDSDKWSDFCKCEARKLEIKFLEKKLNLENISWNNLENDLRNMRYDVFSSLLGRGDYLFTAHHLEDQAETVMLQMLRGAGPKGLAGMPKIKKIGTGMHARPLLNFSKSDLYNYAKTFKLNWIEDSSNFDLRFTRNFLRHEVFPLLQKRWPNVCKTIARVADNCASSEKVLNKYLQQDIDFWLSDKAFGNFYGHFAMAAEKFLPRYEIKLKVSSSQKNQFNFFTFPLIKLEPLSRENRVAIIRKWIASHGFLLPSKKKLFHFLDDMLHARQDRFPCASWGNAEVRRYKGKLYLMQKLPVHDAFKVYHWNCLTEIEIENIGILSMLAPSNLDFLVSFRSGPLDILPEDRKIIKKLFYQQEIPPWLRERMPLIFLQKKLVALSMPSVFDY